jgi:hypothetical protein
MKASPTTHDAADGYESPRKLTPLGHGSEAAAVFHEVRLPPRLCEALKQAADAQETTPSDISCQALAEYLVRNAQASPDEP